MKVKTDFTNTKEYPKMKEGKQKLTVIECVAKDSKNGDPMVVFNLENEDLARVYLYCMNTETNRWGLKQVLAALTGEEQPKGPIEFETEDLINLPLIGRVYHEAYEGKMYPRVDEFEHYDDSLPF